MGKKSSSQKPAAITPTPRAPSPALSQSSSSSSSSSGRSASPAASAAGSSSSESSSDEEKNIDVEAQKAKAAAARRAPLTKYAPPPGMVAVTGAKGTSAVDWDTINSDRDLELWAVRVPSGIKLSKLDGLTIQLPPKNDPLAMDSPLATITSKKGGDFGLYLATEPKAKRGHGAIEGSEDVEMDEDDKPVLGPRGGEEMRSMVPYLPRKSAGDKLFPAPRPVTKRLLVTRTLPDSVLSFMPSASSSLIDSQPCPVPGAVLTSKELLTPNDPAVLAKKITRPQPEHLLKFRLNVAGMGAQGKPRAEGAVDVPLQSSTKEEEDAVVPVKTEKEKKRKGDKKAGGEESPKKKKSKTA